MYTKKRLLIGNHFGFKWSISNHIYISRLNLEASSYLTKLQDMAALLEKKARWRP